MSTIPLPHAAIVQSIQSVQPFSPGDILMIQSATTQANIPVLVLGINKLDPTQFTVDTSTDPDTVRINGSVVTADPAWTVYTPAAVVSVGVATPVQVAGAYLIKGKTVHYRLYWRGSISITSANFNVTIPPLFTNAVALTAAAVSYQIDGVSTYATGVISNNAGVANVSFNPTAGIPIAPAVLTFTSSGVYETI